MDVSPPPLLDEGRSAGPVVEGSAEAGGDPVLEDREEEAVGFM